MLKTRATPFHHVIMSARYEARAAGSRTIEAEHILLALASQEGDAREILESTGLDHDAIRAAIEREFESSLLAVGISLESSSIVSETRRPEGRPRFAQSAKLAVERAAVLTQMRVAPHLEPLHLLLGVLYAKAGTVPRVLATTGVDAADLTRRAEYALSASRGGQQPPPGGNSVRP
jgi:ATP-dependent Clp protease ATP-binding subunit ClpA